MSDPTLACFLKQKQLVTPETKPAFVVNLLASNGILENSGQFLLELHIARNKKLSQHVDSYLTIPRLTDPGGPSKAFRVLFFRIAIAFFVVISGKSIST